MSTLAFEGVELCFANPGTSELHLVAALDNVEGIRGVLVLFEGVATGAADGYGRMAGKPASVLLHLGPGLANGLANLHNARRANSPVICLVGEQATYHRKYDPPLTMLQSIESLVSSVSAEVLTIESAGEITGSVVRAVRRTMGAGGAGRADGNGAGQPGDERPGARMLLPMQPGRVVSVVVPSDVSWGQVGRDRVSVAGDSAAGERTSGEAANMAGRAGARPGSEAVRRSVGDERVEEVASILRSGSPAALLLGGEALRATGIRNAVRIAASTGAKVFADVLPARMERGGSIPSVERLGYLPELALAQLQGLSHLICVDVREPVSFFAYEGIPSSMAPDGCAVTHLAVWPHGAGATLAALAEAVGGASSRSDATSVTVAAGVNGKASLPSGALDAGKLGAVFGALLPEGAIVVDEGVTEGIFAYLASEGAPEHDWLCLSGGAIGQGLPLAVGAALACTDRHVVALEADGSSMYTPQALWTQARESLNVTNIILSNRSYQLLRMELQRFGIDATRTEAEGLTSVGRPEIGFAKLASSFGIESTRVDDAGDFATVLERYLKTEGPTLIEAVL